MTTLVLSGRAPLLNAPGIPLLRSPVTFDLREVDWATPFDIVALSVLYRRLKLRGSAVRVLTPSSADVCRYLVDLGLPAHMSGRWGKRAKSAIHPPLVPLIRLDEPEEWDDLLPELWPHVRHELGDFQLADRVFDILGELIDNATTHGGSETGAFICAQQYTGETSGLEPGIWIGVGDGGIGIPDHLRNRTKYVSINRDQELIRLAWQPWVTGTPDRRGWGLVEVFREATATGVSHVLIRSGLGEGRFRLAEGRSPWARYQPLPRKIGGTWVHLQLKGTNY